MQCKERLINMASETSITSAASGGTLVSRSKAVAHFSSKAVVEKQTGHSACVVSR